MSYKAEVENLIKNLNKIVEKRNEFSDCLSQTAQILQKAELEGGKASGQLFVEREIEDLEIASENLLQGRFRLMVLGDMKHGKSTLLNVLLGKNLLPSAVNPCTAILTIIKFGQKEQVTVHLKGDRTESLSFQEFSKKYTIPEDEAKRFEESKQPAFPDVNYAVVEYPLDLLQNGVEIVDSPGLNDTDERNQLTLGYINNCHAILFVLNATKPCTKEERRYLENYLKGRGLTIFFLINRWDELKQQVFDPEDPVQVRQAEESQRQVFAANLQQYCQVDGSDLYNERVFETSALNALRYRLKGQPLDGTGLPEFIGSLEQFLTRERAIAELRQTRTLMRQTYERIREAVSRRIPLLDQDVTELRQRIKSVEPEFRRLREIRDRYVQEITTMKNRHADAIAESAYNYISKLDETFEADFKPYLPDLNFFSFLLQGKRKEFEEGMKVRFQKYVNDRMANWSLTAELELKNAFSQLAVSASQYGAAYGNITDSINSKLTGTTVSIGSNTVSAEDKYPAWARFATGAVAFIMGDYASATGAAFGVMNWKRLALNVGILIGVNVLLIGFFNVALTPIGAAIVTALSGTTQAEMLRRDFIKKTREEMKKELPNVAQQLASQIHQEVKKLFENFNTEVSKRMDEDLQSRQSELDKLVEQRENGEFERELEVKRLNKLQSDIYSEWQTLEVSYEQIVE